MKLRIEKAVYGGSGLARIPPADESAKENELAGKTVFVPYSLPGELVEAQLKEQRRGFSFADASRILEPSRARVPAACEYFLRCGGCQYQHCEAPFQLEMKLAILRETLARAHVEPAAAEDGSIRSISGPPWAYRNRIRLHVQRNPKQAGGFMLCYRERASHRNLAVTHCPIAAPLLERAIAATLRIGARTKLASSCDEIELFSSGEEDALLVSLTKSGVMPQSGAEEGGFRRFAEDLKSEIPELSAARLYSEGDRRPIGHWGASALEYAASGRIYQVSPGAFFQINRFLIPDLLNLVTGDISGRLAWDLYAGVGLFAQALQFDRVVAVESEPASAADLAYNLRGGPHRAIRSETLDFLRGKGRGDKPDLILVDPPRAGLGPEIVRRIAEAGAPRMVYVSCDPATLARDLQPLLQSGYALASMTLVDLFPQTFHIETVSVLLRP